MSGCGCSSCGCGAAAKAKNLTLERAKLGAALAIGFGAWIAKIPPAAEFALFLISYVLIAQNVLSIVWEKISNFKISTIFDENFLMTIASIGAFAIGEYPEAIAVMLFYRFGEWLEDRAVDKSRASIESLIDLAPSFANKVRENSVDRVDPSEVAIGDILLVKAGEKVPLDGVLTGSDALLDMSSLTGESLPKSVKQGGEILCGAIALDSAFKMRATKKFADSTAAKIADFVNKARENPAKTERFITKFARVYTPIVVALAVLTAVLPPLILGAGWSEWFYKALIFLVVSCPCALLISIPLAFFAGLGAASRSGILIKNAALLESLAATSAIAFDKTGTLTDGAFSLSEVRPENGFEKDEVLRYAAAAESFCGHPIAVSIAAACPAAFAPDLIVSHKTIAGLGVEAIVAGKQVLVGGEKLFNEREIARTGGESGAILVAIDGVFAGRLIVEDRIKDRSAEAIAQLADLGVKDAAILTGDNRAAAEKVAAKLKIPRFFAELLPLEKVEKLREIKGGLKRGQTLAFVGDGINDAPALAIADSGVAINALGSDIAAQAAGVVLLGNDPTSVAKAIRVARKTRRIAAQNIALTLGIKIALVASGLAGLSGMWEAVFGDVGTALIATLNAMRIMKS